MAWVAVAIGGSAIIGAVAGSQASQGAANAETQAANSSNQLQWQEFQDQEKNQQPWLDAGKSALGELQNEMPGLQKQFTMEDFHEDPAYQFDLTQGLNAMSRSAAAKGMLDSTGTMQGLNNYAQGQASNEYQNAYNRFTQSQQQRYNMLAGVAGTGQVANGQLGQAGMNAANNMSANTIGAGNAAAAGGIAQGNMIGNLAGTGANAWMNYNMMNNMFPKTGSNIAGGSGYGGGFNGSGGLSMPELGSSAVPAGNPYGLLSE